MKSGKKSGLGKGLKALLEENDAFMQQGFQLPIQDKEAKTGEVSFVKIEQIDANPYQPRTEFDQESLVELSESISVQGIIQPITLRKISDIHFQLISGERRLRAAKMTGLDKIPAYIRTANDQDMLEMGLIENIQRENLNPLEIALCLQRMTDEIGFKQEDLARRVSKNRATVANYLRLLKLPPLIQAALRDGKITMGHAKAILSVADVDKQIWLYHQITDKDLSVRNTEELAQKLVQAPKTAIENKQKSSASIYIKKIQDDLASKFEARVSVKVDDKGRGKIEIPVASTEDLNRILDLIG